MQRGEADLALGAIVDEECHNIFVALLEGHGQGGEAILRGEKRNERGSGDKREWRQRREKEDIE